MEQVHDAIGLWSSIGIGVLIVLALGTMLARFYRRATPERAFVRTGSGQERAVISGGAMVLPVLHEIRWVGLTTLQLSVERRGTDALITNDSRRADVQADFYVRVRPDAGSVKTAARTLGERTLEPLRLKELIEGKFVDALRAVAATMALQQLHERRMEFVQEVQNTVAPDLAQNGLELESVSLTYLDQTDPDHLDPRNSFDARGLTLLTKETEEKKRERNQIEELTRVDIARRKAEADQQEFAIRQERAKVEAESAALIARQEAESAAASAEAREEARRREQTAELIRDRAIQEATLERDRSIEEARIANQRHVELAMVERDREVQQATLNRNRALEEAKIQNDRLVELAEQESQVAIAAKSREVSQARAEAEDARAAQVRAEEAVQTEQERARAERSRQIAVIHATQEAEVQATAVRVAAEAEKRAAADRAEAVQVETEAEAARTERLGAAERARMLAEAEGRRALNEAENALSDRIVGLRIRQATLDTLPGLMAAAVKPAEKIGNISIVQLDGLAGLPSGGGNGEGTGGGNGSAADQLVSAVLRHRMYAPLVDKLLADVDIGDLGRLDALVQDARPPTAPDRPEADAAPDTGRPKV